MPLLRAGCAVLFLPLLPSRGLPPLHSGEGLEGSPRGGSAALFMSLAEGSPGGSLSPDCSLLSMQTDKYGNVRGQLPCQESGVLPHPVCKPPAEAPQPQPSPAPSSSPLHLTTPRQHHPRQAQQTHGLFPAGPWFLLPTSPAHTGKEGLCNTLQMHSPSLPSCSLQNPLAAPLPPACLPELSKPAWASAFQS